MTSPPQPTPTELQQAIERLTHRRECETLSNYWCEDDVLSLNKVLSAATRTQELERKFTEHSNRELLGETERCEFEAAKTRVKGLESKLQQVEKERDELNAIVKTVEKAIDKAEALNNSSSDNEIAASASFNEAVAHTLLEQNEVKYEQLHSIAEKLAQTLTVAINTVECDSLDHLGNELPWYKQAHEALQLAKQAGINPETKSP